MHAQPKTILLCFGDQNSIQPTSIGFIRIFLQQRSRICLRVVARILFLLCWTPTRLLTTHQRVVGAEELDVLRDADEAVSGWMRQPGGDGQLDLGVVLVKLV